MHVYTRMDAYLVCIFLTRNLVLKECERGLSSINYHFTAGSDPTPGWACSEGTPIQCGQVFRVTPLGLIYPGIRSQ